MDNYGPILRSAVAHHAHQSRRLEMNRPRAWNMSGDNVGEHTYR